MTELTVTQLRQLLTYCGQCELDGWYYGNKVQFESRHKAIVEWITAKLYTSQQPAQKTQEIVHDAAEIRRVFEIDQAEWPEPESGFAKL